jgi:ATP-dependent DNA helicase RecG
MKTDYLTSLVKELCSLSKETEWVEFKHNNKDPEKIGQNISALSNSAAINRKTNGYIVWGLENQTHEIIGTT